MEHQPNKLEVSLFADTELMRLVRETEEGLEKAKKRQFAEKKTHYENRLDAHFFQTEASRTRRLLGMAALHPMADDIEAFGQTITYFTDVTIRGFEIHRTIKDNVYLKFDVPAPKEKQEKAQPYYLPEKSTSYLIRPSNIISMFDSPEQIRSDMQESLIINAVTCDAQLTQFDYLPPEQKNFVLNRLAENAGQPFMHRNNGKNVSIAASSYYTVDYDSQGPFLRPETVRSPLSDPNDEVLLYTSTPHGKVTKCLFIEQVLFASDKNDMRYAEPLMLREPCIVLENEGRPQYLVPISKVEDVQVLP